MSDLEDRRPEGVEADGAVENIRVDDARRHHPAHLLLLRPLTVIPFPPLFGAAAAATLLHCYFASPWGRHDCLARGCGLIHARSKVGTHTAVSECRIY